MINISILCFKWDQVIDCPIGSIISSLTLQFGAKVGIPFVFRQMVIIIFICRMHCFLFKNCNNYFTQLSENRRKKNLKTYISLHYKLFESVKEFQKYLQPMFVLNTTIWCPLFCYIIYFNLKNSENESNLVIILINIAALIMFIFSIILSGFIAMIDTEGKKGLHSIYRCALKLSNKETIFKVSHSTRLFSKISICFIFVSSLSLILR